MDERESKKRLIDHVDPNRRDFVRRIMGGTTFIPPLIATFSIDSLTASAAEEQRIKHGPPPKDSGYVGPSVFQAQVSDPNSQTEANGVANLTIVDPALGDQSGTLQITLVMTDNSTVNSAHLLLQGTKLCSVPANGGLITPQDCAGVSDFNELLQAMVAGLVTLAVDVTLGTEIVTLTGSVLPASSAVIKLGS